MKLVLLSTALLLAGVAGCTSSDARLQRVAEAAVRVLWMRTAATTCSAGPRRNRC